MEKEKLQTVAEMVWSSFEIPAYCLKRREIICSFPDSGTCFCPPKSIIDSVAANDGIIWNSSFGASYVKIAEKDDDEYMLLLGPVSTVPYDLPALTRIIREYSVPSENWTEASNFFKLIPTIPFILLIHRIRFVILALCGKNISFEEIKDQNMIHDNGQTEKKTNKSSKDKLIVPNNSYEVENTILGFVSNGDTKGLARFIAHMPNFYPGIVAPDALRNFKNYFITICTLATRSAIRAGIPTGTAFELSDKFISRLETLGDLEKVNSLYDEMLTEFTKQVATRKDFLKVGTLEGLPLPVRSAILYVQSHVYDELDVEIVSEELGYSRSYLSKVFSRSMGFCLSDFIFRCKLEESKVLLTYSSKKISEIAACLGFSSQSHFQKRFKETFHATPNEYRKTHSSYGDYQSEDE